MSLRERLIEKVEEKIDSTNFSDLFDQIASDGIVDVSGLVDISIMLSILTEDKPDSRLGCHIDRLRHLVSGDLDVTPLNYYEALYLITEFERISKLKRKRSEANMYI